MVMEKRGLRDRCSFLEGRVEIFAYQNGVLSYHEILKNIIFYQGLRELIRGATSSPYGGLPTAALHPRVITRMAIGDQGTIPSDATIAKVPTKVLTSLYNETYRQDISAANPTLYDPTGFSYTGTTTSAGYFLTGMSSTFGVTPGIVVTDSASGIPVGTLVVAVINPTTIQISNPATSSNVRETITFAGAINECELVSTFNATDVPLTSFSNPSNPVVNEVGLVIIDPSISPGYSRPPLAAPDANPNAGDEVVLSLRTFKSVPFVAANNTQITIRYTLYTQ